MSNPDELVAWTLAQVDAAPPDLGATPEAPATQTREPLPGFTKCPRTHPATSEAISVPRAAWPTVHGALARWGATFTTNATADPRWVTVRTDAAGARIARRYAQAIR